jgi:TonB-linked SusC/RagA family outer membrane protein
MKSKTIQLRKLVLFLVLMILSFDLLAQVTVTGVVTDESGNSLPGVNVFEKGTTNGTITDLDGKYMLRVQNGTTITFSFIGYDDQEFSVSGTKQLNVVLKESTQEIEEVVVVGYGQQKKASVVGAITQTTGKVLERAGGISNVGAALTGNLPGVVTAQNSGQPGEEDPKIQIRGASSWNNSEPLVLVDGVERSMSSVDISSVQSISVLKDASATAVYGVKGANGVILVTTKRGQEGSAKIDAGFSTTLKTISKLPSKMDSYDALMARNEIIEHELAVAPQAWNYIRSQEFINNYRNQTSVEQRERYPNVNWQDYLFKDAAVSYNAYVNVSGGTKFVRYYAAVDYVNEGDLYDIPDNGRAYSSEFAYQRINVRSNLDFNITKSTVLKVNLSGSNGIRHIPWRHMQYSGDAWQQGQAFASAYSTPPDVFLPRYSDGSWGIYPDDKNLANSAVAFALGGAAETSTTQVNTDFILEQSLEQWVKGLNLRAFVSMDNSFLENNRGISDMWNDPATTYINPVTGEATKPTTNGNPEKFRFFDAPKWNTQGGSINDWNTARRLYYQAQVNYARKFGDHNVGAMVMFSRSQNSYGPGLPVNREDWAFRATYDWKGKYTLQHNSSYNTDPTSVQSGRFFWQDDMGDLEYVRYAVAFARKYFKGDPKDLKLFINDYNLESDWDDNKKLKSLINWIKKWESDGETYIDGIGTQMHISCYEDDGINESKKKHIRQMFQLMAATGKLVRVSELDMGYVRKGSNKGIATADVKPEEHKKMADLYKFVIESYFELVPPEQQYGICQWCLTDAGGQLGTGWRGGEPVGIWTEGYKQRKEVYKAWADALKK